MEPLRVKSVHLHPSKNSTPHHTRDYELVHLDIGVGVFRRGQIFSSVIEFENREYDHKTDQVIIIFSLGSNANVIKKTKGAMFLTKENQNLDIYQWSATITEQKGKSIDFEVNIPCDAPIGKWNLSVETRFKTSKDIYSNHENDFYILFNPWNKDDQVYMEDESMLNEYVLNDVGKIWMGMDYSREWIFGQFDDVILPACMLLLDRSGLPTHQRGDPVKVSRSISKIVNSNDDQGVLVGRWPKDGKDYPNGTPPSAWTGSVSILQKFMETKESVKYGQCWVFGGVVTTVCRALGIPSRVVSNIVSAHDTNGSLTIDEYFDEKMDEMNFTSNSAEGSDSIWNFHVWNDVWMARLDLPKGYGGWQAIDATPQEKSAGIYQCGPASLEAIKQGAVGYQYDVPFVLAAVNADVMKWKKDPTQALGFSRISTDKNQVGKAILTKRPLQFDHNGNTDREDVTEQYKSAEGTLNERLALYNGAKSIERAKRSYAVPDASKEDVKFDLVKLDKIKIGEPFDVSVKISNKSSEKRTVNATLKTNSITYTGIIAENVKKVETQFSLMPNSEEFLKCHVEGKDYITKLEEHCYMKLNAIFTVEETNQVWATDFDFQILSPNIEIKLHEEPKVNKELTVSLTFKNPLDRNLTKCEFRVAGPSLVKKTLVIPHDDAPPNSVLLATAKIIPTYAKELKLIVTFSSSELVGITGNVAVNVGK